MEKTKTGRGKRGGDPVVLDKRSRIIERAIIMFNEIGYERVRVSDITDSLNIGKGTFYLYFENKKDLLLHCFERMGELVLELESLVQVYEGSYFEKIGPRVEAVDRYDWFPGLINLLRVSAMSPDEEIKVNAREAYETIAYPLKRDLEAAISQGIARDVDAELAAFAFIGMAENVYFRSRFDDARYRPADVVDFMIDATTQWLAKGSSTNGGAAQGRYLVRLMARDGNQFDLDSVRFDGETHLRASLGHAKIEVNRSRLASLTVELADEQCLVTLVMTDGATPRLSIDPNVAVSGEAAFGTVRIAIGDVASLTFAAEGDQPVPPSAER